MNTLTIELPESVDPAVARWEMVRALYKNGDITLEQGAEMVDLTPAYFRIRLQKPPDSQVFQAKQELLASAKPLDRERFDELIEQLDIKEPFNELVAMIGK